MKKSKKSPSKKTSVLGPVPASYEEAGPEDRLILRMKETEGKSWNEIQKAIEEMTGGRLGGSTLRVRYTKLKANFVVFEKEDVSIFPFTTSVTLSYLFCFISLLH